MKGQKRGATSTVFPDDHKLAILGHELGNVLNGLLGMAELLGNSGLTAEQGRWLRAIEYSGRQMESLIRSGRFFRNASQPAGATHRARVDGLEILEQVVISHTPAARLRNNRLFLVVQPELSRYWLLDPCPVRQLLDNLVGNAIKFTRSGEIVIEAAAVPFDGKPGGAVRFRISDTGPGFGAATAEQIFAAYRRGPAPGKAGSGNRGLGLYICRGIASAMRGRITCSSPKGGGACFEVVLPGALPTEDSCPPALRSTLLDPVRCQLRLEGEIRRSVVNFLTRLEVQCSDKEGALPGQGLTLLVSEAPQQWTGAPPSLLFRPCTPSGVAPKSKVLEAPLLESSLGVLLLEIAFEWRSLELRDENPDSIPRPH
jgi:hypothetical protein